MKLDEIKKYFELKLIKKINYKEKEFNFQKYPDMKEIIRTMEIYSIKGFENISLCIDDASDTDAVILQFYNEKDEQQWVRVFKTEKELINYLKKVIK